MSTKKNKIRIENDDMIMNNITIYHANVFY